MLAILISPIDGPYVRTASVRTRTVPGPAYERTYVVRTWADIYFHIGTYVIYFNISRSLSATPPTG